MPRAPWLLFFVPLLSSGCSGESEAVASGRPTGSVATAPAGGGPEGIAPPMPSASLEPLLVPPLPSSAPPPAPKCPADMVLVWQPATRAGHYCVDRFEAVMVDDATGQTLSPYWPPEGGKAGYLEKVWSDQRGSGTALEQSMPLPPLPAWQKQKKLKPRAVSKKGVIPQAYASGKDGALACESAGKRLCTMEEWKRACRGEEDRDFPYGTAYKHGVCNVVGDVHPGVLLWENPSINHTDPRFNLVKGNKGAALLRLTGGTPTCTSRWGDDAIYDMVGNLDEWIDDPEGTFVGAFYARGRRDGCNARVTNHTWTYADYSTGVRCCKAVE